MAFGFLTYQEGGGLYSRPLEPRAEATALRAVSTDDGGRDDARADYLLARVQLARRELRDTLALYLEACGGDRR